MLSKTYSNIACPSVSGNGLVLKSQKISSEWDYVKNYPLIPSDVSYGSEKQVWFLCEKKHSWKSRISNRFHGKGCPYCANQKVCTDNCLSTLNSKLALEWHPTKNGKLTPKDVTSHSGKIFWWKCKMGHEYQCSINNRQNGCGCPCCSGHVACIDNCLATVNPKLAKEWHPTKNGKLTVYDVTVGSDKKVWWKCKNGHEYQCIIGNRQNGMGCSYCAGKKVNKDNCLLTLNLNLSKEWNYDKNGNLNPRNITVSSGKKVWWKCSSCDHEWEASVSNRNSGGNGCPYCQGVILKDGTHCDSIVEAYMYLKYKKDKKIFVLHGRYGSIMGKCRYDFYFPLENKYVEVTGYDKHCIYVNYFSYLRNIVAKRRYVREKLHANFEFIQLRYNKSISKYVLDNSLRGV